MNHLDGVELAIVIVSFLVVTASASPRRGGAARGPTHLNESGLDGRGFGTFVTWFLLGGDIYTAYTFVAVPA